MFHSNIKPSNIILKDKNNNNHPKKLPDLFAIAEDKGNI